MCENKACDNILILSKVNTIYGANEGHKMKKEKGKAKILTNSRWNRVLKCQSNKSLSRHGLRNTLVRGILTKFSTAVISPYI